MNTKALKADSLLLITAMIWGAAFVAQRMGMDHVGPFTFNGVRFALGALALWPLILKKPGRLTWGGDLPVFFQKRPVLWGGALTGAVLFFGATFQQVGLVYTTAGKAAFITGLYVILVPLVGLFWGYRLAWGGWVGAFLALLGLYFLSVTEELTLSPGDLLELLGSFFWAGHVLILGWLSPRIDVLRLAAAQYVACAILSLATALWLEPITIQGLTGAAVPILYGGIMSVGVAYTLQVVAQREAPPAHAAIILSLETVFAALTGWLILDEVLSARSLLGCVLMFAGMLFAQLKS
ncbi:DMT family transporter [Dethiosulfatarculus sandiegensis]|uniref:Membrane protein n=1 Tax=Dethiosulfatarculus sandiegensis TaxID=1429043 RepID=A0A0D2K1K2_9BACT|nr:DMT family transporter [Dethiosulfatarculus sandiegensis]KIX15535.1 membrane protein [Dethiosulfatarculus sandiegensis]